MTSAFAILERGTLSWPEKLAALAVRFRDNGDMPRCPVSHRFEPELYIREIFVPRGTYFIGRAHRHGHRMSLDAGKIRFIMENGQRTLEAPYELTSLPYFMTAFEALTDVWGSTYHANPENSRNIDALENDIFFPSDEVYRIGESVLGYERLPGVM